MKAKFLFIVLIPFVIVSCGYFETNEFPVSEKTPHAIGSIENGALVSKVGQGGVLAFGPYVELAPGQYLAKFDISSSAGGGNKESGTVDVSMTKNAKVSLLGQAPIIPDRSVKEHLVAFTVTENDKGATFEFRVISLSVSVLTFRGVKVSPL